MGTSRLGVCGAGLMGQDIALVAARAGLEVTLYELEPDALAHGVGRVEATLAGQVERGRVSSDDAEAARARILGTGDLTELADADWVIEAITEDRGAKLALWHDVDAVARPGARFATNTSSLSVVEQATATRRPERFVGLHFFNPAPVMRLVEVVPGLTTSEETVRAATELAVQLGKEPVLARDAAGFVVNRLLVPYLLDAIRAWEEGVADVESIDRAMRLGAGHPMGPLALADLVGLDTLAAIGEVMFAERREPRMAAPATLRRMVAAGWFGAKSGRGFYVHEGGERVPNPALA